MPFDDPHTHGTCCGACAQASQPSATPATTGAPLVFAWRGGVPVGARLVVEGRGHDQQVTLVKRQTVLGRSPSADVTIRDVVLSRRQCQVVMDEDGVWVEDLRSACGTVVNGERVAAARRLCEGDRIHVGDVVVRVVRDRSLREEPPLDR